MVLLTMTASVVEGLGYAPAEVPGDKVNEAPSLEEPAVGKPIAHGQIVDLWKRLKTIDEAPSLSLEKLLIGAKVYVPPPPPKREQVRVPLSSSARQPTDTDIQTPEFKALMARLRRDEEEREYERMINPSSHEAHGRDQQAFAAVNQPHTADDTGDDDGITYNDVHRQLLLLINFLVSIVGVAATLWIAARWWSLPARLFLTMGGAVVVAIAEVAVYSIYVWRLGDAKHKQEEVKETREVAETWTVGEAKVEDEAEDDAVLIEAKESATSVRKRVAVKEEEKEQD